MRNSACATPGLIFEIPVTLLGAIVFGGLGGYFLGPWSGAIGATIGLASGFQMDVHMTPHRIARKDTPR